MTRILVTPRSLTAASHPSLQRLAARGYDVVLAPPGRQPAETDLLRLVPGCAGWLAGVEPVSPAVIEAAGELRAISRDGVGTDNLPMELVRARGITVRTADGANAVGVAELAIGLMLAALRHIPQADEGIKAGAWPRRLGREVRGRTVGVVGCGAIGREVARLAAALGAAVLAHDPLRPPGIAVRWAKLPELLERADIVSLHCPSAAEGRSLIGAAELATMRAGAVLNNPARAALVDEDAVSAALDAGRLGVYATDVFAHEPPTSLALAGHAAVVATSHIGGFTEESVARATELAVVKLVEALEAPRAPS